ncbi:endopeptidase La [Ferrimonas balearica]|uniref:endopeptidase La n=1 Tax=Ferrimonas balearica TaxID=44012 RepID=UPI001C559A59|nr:endopeptidase La [Ferrimonas balearica]MBW3163503.1 endopeptidase La [Ferrimonas balearica]MBY6223453.1 endopeptidase La [Ferrimonas balearica]
MTHTIDEFNADWHLDMDEPSDTGTELIPAQPNRPETLPVMPVQNRPFFPAQVMPVAVKGGHWEATLQAVQESDHKLMALFYSRQSNAAEGVLDKDALAKTGCVVRVHEVRETEDGHFHFVAEGMERCNLLRWVSDEQPYMAELSYPIDEHPDTKEIKAYAIALIAAIKELIPLNPLYSEELKQYLERFGPHEPSPLTDFAAAITTAKAEPLQAVLDTVSLLPRMEKTLALLKNELDAARLHSEISEQVNQKLEKREREFFLREQLKVIQRELGVSKDDKTADAEEFRERLKGKTLPEAVEKRLNEELQKLSVLETGSPEYAVTRNYLDWLTQVPWGVFAKDSIELAKARKVLDKHHDGLADVKDRILEFLAVGAFKGDIGGSIILLVGPPGVGKTSIGKSIAECLGRPFYRFSVGGMRDEAEIKGHRRTYIGAMPGKLVQALKEAEVMNPVIMLDEIDKMGKSYQGDPASALLETLDPEQNVAFLDHYLDQRLDLSKALFVCTANTLDSIPGPLLDRMDVIRLSGYLAEEKLAIAKHHLWPRQLEKAGLKRSQLRISDPALRIVIDGYAREAGVRALEKQLAKLVRKSVVQLMENEQDKASIGIKDIEPMLGMPRFKAEDLLSGVGIVTGLAWTSLGGATLPVEARRIHEQRRGLHLSGQLGDVMKESATIAHSYVSANLAEGGSLAHYGDATNYFDNAHIHLHVPDGATPKDGPSAGITMATALLSLALNRAPRSGVAMTGELSLTGQVMAVGGIREKVISAKRQKITTVILPDANRGDFDELPDYVKAGITVHFAERFEQVAEWMFGQ